MGAWERWKAKHWEERTEGYVSGPDCFSPGEEVAPPLRKFARWVRENGWALVTALIGFIGALAALIQALR